MLRVLVVLTAVFLLLIVVLCCIDRKIPEDFPLIVFTTAITVLLTSIILPQIAAGLSGSIIAQGFVIYLFQKPRHQLFLALQAIIALLAIATEYRMPTCRNPNLLSHLLLGAIVLDVIFIVCYLGLLVSLIAKPEKLCKEYVSDLSVKGICKPKTWASLSIATQHRTLVDIGKDARPGYEKDIILQSFRKILERAFNNSNTPWQSPGNFVKENQFILWRYTVKGISECCIKTKDEVQGDETNAVTAIRVLKYAWSICEQWKPGLHDFEACTKSIAEIASYCVGRGYTTGAFLGAEALGEIGKCCLKTQGIGLTSPLVIAGKMSDIGVRAIYAGRGSMSESYVVWLISFLEFGTERSWEYLFYIVRVLAIRFEKEPQALSHMKKILKSIDHNHENKIIIEYCEKYYPNEISEFNNFLDAVSM